MVDATWVPWPCPSSTVWPGTKLAVVSTRPARSGWPRSTPVSRTATFTPLPSYPADHASGAPIWAVLSDRSTCTLPSSQIFWIPSARTGFGFASYVVVEGVRASQTLRICRLAALTAEPRTLGKGRTFVVPAGTGFVAPLASA